MRRVLKNQLERSYYADPGYKLTDRIDSESKDDRSLISQQNTCPYREGQRKSFNVLGGRFACGIAWVVGSSRMGQHGTNEI
jgi:hypothetical protein